MQQSKRQQRRGMSARVIWWKANGGLFFYNIRMNEDWLVMWRTVPGMDHHYFNHKNHDLPYAKCRKPYEQLGVIAWIQNKGADVKTQCCGLGKLVGSGCSPFSTSVNGNPSSNIFCSMLTTTLIMQNWPGNVKTLLKNHRCVVIRLSCLVRRFSFVPVEKYSAVVVTKSAQPPSDRTENKEPWNWDIF